MREYNVDSSVQGYLRNCGDGRKGNRRAAIAGYASGQAEFQTFYSGMKLRLSGYSMPLLVRNHCLRLASKLYAVIRRVPAQDLERAVVEPLVGEVRQVRTVENAMIVLEHSADMLGRALQDADQARIRAMVECELAQRKESTPMETVEKPAIPAGSRDVPIFLSGLCVLCG